MIWGVNFGRPTCQGMGFKENIKLPGMGRGEYAHLVGVCDTAAERDTMLEIATNGHRKLYVEISCRGLGQFAIYSY